MGLIKGIEYNLRGLGLGLKTPKLLLLGLTRLAAVVVLTVFSASTILLHHQALLNLIWERPESLWIVWLWHLVSWLFAGLLMGLAAILAYLVAQILFSVVIMDTMSLVTERIVTGIEETLPEISLLQRFLFLIRQEIPRTIIPLLVVLTVMLLGWLTPMGPLLTFISSGVSVIFLAWDNTDLLPARHLEPFRKRFKQLLKSLLFHLGFGLWFLIPVLNILFLSFAPVGATLYHLEKRPAAVDPPESGG